MKFHFNLDLKYCKAFTLIEVLIATAIASVAIVGTFLLMQWGINQSQNIAELEEFNEVFLGTRSCILLENIPALDWTTKSVWYTKNGCFIGAYVVDMSFPGTEIQRYSQDIPAVKKVYKSYFAVTADGVVPKKYSILHHLESDIMTAEKTYTVFR